MWDELAHWALTRDHSRKCHAPTCLGSVVQQIHLEHLRSVPGRMAHKDRTQPCKKKRCLRGIKESVDGTSREQVRVGKTCWWESLERIVLKMDLGRAPAWLVQSVEMRLNHRVPRPSLCGGVQFTIHAILKENLRTNFGGKMEKVEDE